MRCMAAWRAEQVEGVAGARVGETETISCKGAEATEAACYSWEVVVRSRIASTRVRVLFSFLTIKTITSIIRLQAGFAIYYCVFASEQ